MWHSGQSGIAEKVPVVGQRGQGLLVPLGLGEGAYPKGGLSSNDSKYDSHNDSGFLSDSNLASSSCLSCDDPTSTTNMRSEHLGIAGEAQHLARSPDKADLTQGKLDSGIDISEQLSSLHLASSNTSSSSCCSSSTEAAEADSSTKKPASPPTRRSRLELSEAQVALLQEIFKTDEDGDTQLHVAVMRGFIEVIYHITRLLPHQAFLDLANHTGRVRLVYTWQHRVDTRRFCST
ncbi:hypothetical protein OTU49_007176 [Cherax quadricarinatus]|uniref:Uncharacterized protein n=1 Tax=Cherax quadricarinatus TaxID=27406 RepID=A0AAW0WXD6_CHEQU